MLSFSPEAPASVTALTTSVITITVSVPAPRAPAGNCTVALRARCVPDAIAPLSSAS